MVTNGIIIVTTPTFLIITIYFSLCGFEFIVIVIVIFHTLLILSFVFTICHITFILLKRILRVTIISTITTRRESFIITITAILQTIAALRIPSC